MNPLDEALGACLRAFEASSPTTQFPRNILQEDDALIAASLLGETSLPKEKERKKRMSKLAELVSGLQNFVEVKQRRVEASVQAKEAEDALGQQIDEKKRSMQQMQGELTSLSNFRKTFEAAEKENEQLRKECEQREETLVKVRQTIEASVTERKELIDATKDQLQSLEKAFEEKKEECAQLERANDADEKEEEELVRVLEGVQAMSPNSRKRSAEEAGANDAVSTPEQIQSGWKKRSAPIPRVPSASPRA